MAGNISSPNQTGSSEAIRSITPVWITFAKELQIWHAVMITLNIVGVIASIVLIITIASSKLLRAKSGTLILTLLVQVTFQCGIGMPLVVLSYHGLPFSQSWDRNFCNHSFIIYQSLTVSIDWTEVMISSNRFVAVCFPHIYPKLTKKKILCFMSLLPYVIGFGATALVQAGISGSMLRFSAWDSCTVIYSTPAWTAAYLIVGIGFPLGFSFVLYLLIFVIMAARRWTGNKTVHPGNQDLRKTQRRYRSVRMFFVIFVFYASCLLPAPVAAGPFLKAYSARPLLQLIFRAIVAFGLAFIPVIYFALSSQYRLRTKQLIGKCFGLKIDPYKGSHGNAVSYNTRTMKQNNGPSTSGKMDGKN